MLSEDGGLSIWRFYLIHFLLKAFLDKSQPMKARETLYGASLPLHTSTLFDRKSAS